MAEANYFQEGHRVDFTPASALTAGDVVQIPDGRAGVATSAIAAGELGSVAVEGIFEVAKTADVALLQGGECRWDASADAAHVPTYADSDDFFLGTVVEDAAATASVVKVAINQRSCPVISLDKSTFINEPRFTSGSPYARMMGGAFTAGFSETAEAQKQDILSVESVSVDSNWIFDGVLTIQTNGDAGQVDIVFGVADDTNADNPNNISEKAVVNVEPGTSTNINAWSDDGTTEVGATDTTVDWSVGTPFHAAIDGRDHTDIKFYIDGVRVLSGSTFTLADASGPLKGLFMMEKAANDTPCEMIVSKLDVRITPDI